MNRREFLKAGALALSSGAPMSAVAGAAPREKYPYLGRSGEYQEFQVIDPGSTITRIESWTHGSFGFVRLSTSDNREGWGQLSSFEPDLTATVLHRQVAPRVLGKDPAQIDAIVDAVIDANMKFPWSYVCRALSGVDTALWDLYGKIKEKPVYALLGENRNPFPVYGSSMRRDISPQDEATRLAALRDSHGYKAFKVRAGQAVGHDRDASPGRTEALIPAVRKAVGDDVRLLADGNSCYSPPRAVEVGRLMQDHGYFFFEEPCPYWELEWTAEVAEALQMNVAGGEQDNDLAQWRRMIRMNAVDIVQPDIFYVGGITRAWRVAQMARQAGKPVVPHSSHHSLVTLFSLHFMAAIPNAGPFVEYSIEQSANEGGALYSPQLKVEDGMVRIPDSPGWGVVINPAWLEAAAYQKSERQAKR